jgi:hypothetical protein
MLVPDSETYTHRGELAKFAFFKSSLCRSAIVGPESG